ncbi:hypothetical protein BH23ACT10_BH23ACT10_11840 [soil metagenome]
MPGDHQNRNGSSGLPEPRSTPDEITRWLGGLFVTSVRYLFMRVPSYRRDRFDEDEASMPDFDRELPGDPSAIQRVRDGLGSLYHRHFWIEFTDAAMDTDELIAALASDLNAAAPGEVSDFETGDDERSGSLQVGAELVVRLPGPWDGPVRVIDRTPTSFRFATLNGHMEAGEIEFRATSTERGYTRFEIETWARSGDRRFRVLYDALPLAREAQAFMWAHFCSRMPKLADGIVMSNVAVNTERVETGVWLDTDHADRPTHQTAPVSGRAHRALLDLPGRAHNFDPDDHAHRAAAGWNLDDYCVALPAEAPGPPVDGGPFEIACQVCANYEFPDPDIVRAIWFDDLPLEQRHMLLEARFLVLRFRFGLKVGDLLDTTDDIDGRPARRWGWNYRTLDGHLERGQMNFEVRKWLDTGEVEFRIDAYSQRAHIDNPVVRFGMWVFGRSQQLRFARHALQRMQRLVDRRMTDRSAAA